MKRIVLLSLLILLPSIASAAPKVISKYKYYDISPSGPDDIWKQISRRSPMRNNVDGNVAATCQWGIKWQSWIKEENTRYKISRAEVTLKVIYTMPRLAQGADKKTAAAFKKIYAKIFAHEQGHMQNGLIGAKKVERKLLKLPEKSSLKELKRLSKKTAARIIMQATMADDNYDRYTQHGIAR